MRKLIPTSLLIASAVALAACGGGDNSSAPHPQPKPQEAPYAINTATAIAHLQSDVQQKMDDGATDGSTYTVTCVATGQYTAICKAVNDAMTGDNATATVTVDPATGAYVTSNIE